MNELLKNIPKVDTLLEHESLQPYLQRYRRDFVVQKIRETLDLTRQEILSGSLQSIDIEALIERMIRSFVPGYRLKPVINATGVVIHTNLGRSVLSPQVMQHVYELSTAYSNLEYDLVKGERGERYDHLVPYLKRLCGCEDAHIVNNNAAAVMLVLHSMAEGKEVIVSRGELVEIGGSFRIPDVMSISGALLKEVGTTNRTHLRDYEEAISDHTALLMKVHQSNYYMEGFTAEVSMEQLHALAREKELPLYEDLGSGYFVDLPFTEKLETLREKLKSIDVLSISGDKLLGGVQAGIILGKRKYVQAMKKDQLTRALRVDKMTLAALEALFIQYEQDPLEQSIPTLNMLGRSYEEIELQAKAFMAQLALPSVLEEGHSLVGGGSLPRVRIPTPKILIACADVTALESYLRSLEKPIICTVRDQKLIIDLRCVFAEDLAYMLDKLNAWTRA